MTSAQARAWVSGLEILGMRFGLERIHALLAALGHPERTAPALHVVGTNGKSSTALLAAAALAGEGRRTGSYLSPHVTDWTERIQIDGAPIGEAGFAAALTAVRRESERLDLPGDAVTQFEALTAAAFWAFREAGAEAVAIEAGLGGRYDATNVLAPGAAVALTNVALEHTDLLGPTEASIAAEKLAVVADGSERLVVGPLSAAARAAVDAECARRRLRPLRYGRALSATEAERGVDVVTPRGLYPALPLALRGRFQRENLAVALAGAEMVVGGPLDPGRLGPAVAAVRMPGRLEVVPGRPPIVLDGAHNPAGVAAMVESLPAVVEGRDPSIAVVSILADKDAAAMLGALAPAVSSLVATRSRHPRALAPEELAARAREAGVPARAVEEPGAALAEAVGAAGPDGVVVVAGSLFLLADLRPRILHGKPDLPGRLAPARKGIDPDEAN